MDARHAALPWVKDQGAISGDFIPAQGMEPGPGQAFGEPCFRKNHASRSYRSTPHGPTATLRRRCGPCQGCAKAASSPPHFRPGRIAPVGLQHDRPQDGDEGRISMQHLLTASLVVCACALVQPAMADEDGPAVPVQNASYHLPVFGNDQVMVLNVYIPPGRGSNYHTHSLDQISVLVEDADQTGQVMGGPVTGPRHGTRGNVNYSADSQHNVTHRGSNVGQTPFHNIVVALKKPGPEGLTAGTRDVPAYQQVVDNERLRAWRLILEPGQSVPAITQKSPGMRIVVDGGEIVESAPGARDRNKAVKLGEFFWQDGGETRAIRNVGTTRVQLVEFELK
jgi:hypothetical protein